MKEEKFKVINYIRELVLTVDKELENYPKKDIEIKNRIRTSTYDLLELAHEANSSLLIEVSSSDDNFEKGNHCKYAFFVPVPKEKYMLQMLFQVSNEILNTASPSFNQTLQHTSISLLFRFLFPGTFLHFLLTVGSRHREIPLHLSNRLRLESLLFFR